jgi:hypothetical protein
MNYKELKVKPIGIKALDFKTKDGETRHITAKQYPELFKKLTTIIKEAEKNGTLWNDQ